MAKVHAEIQYKDIHSDICPRNCSFENIDSEYRAMLHKCLDEWLNKSNGDGYFMIGSDDFVCDLETTYNN